MLKPAYDFMPPFSLKGEPGVRYRGIPGIPGYRVGDDGSVWSCARMGNVGGFYADWRRMSLARGATGYLAVVLRGQVRHYVHRLVLLAFVGPCPNGMQACHNDGDRANNRLANLRWDTVSANHADKHAHGTSSAGERNGMARLTAAQAIAIRHERASGVSAAELSQRYGVSRANVYRVLSRELWAQA